MKIHLRCSNPLLERTLQLFLSEHLVGLKDCDFIISDESIKHAKPVFKIANDGHFALPFSSSQLLEALEEFASTITQQTPILHSFEEQLDVILARFKSDILQLVSNAR